MKCRVEVLELSKPGDFSVLVPTVEAEDLKRIVRAVKKHLIISGYKILKSSRLMIVAEEQIGFKEAIEFSANKALARIRKERRREWER